jgi:hypothetical protein
MRYSHYKFTVILFGLMNVLTTCIDLMLRIFQLYLDKFIVIFIDDILIYSKSKEEHAEHLMLVLERLREHSCMLNFANVNTGWTLFHFWDM